MAAKVTVTCKESGIAFEADSKRTQQHPLIASMKTQANKDGNYRELNDALVTVRKAGGYTTIDEYIAKVNAIVAGKAEASRAAHDARAMEYRKEQDAREQRKRERAAVNEKLRANGYKWIKSHSAAYWGGDDDDAATHWELWSSDGRIVSERQALDEIERGVEVVKAEQVAKVKVAAEAEAKKQQEEEQNAKSDAAALDEFDRALSALLDGMTQVARESFKSVGFEKVLVMSKVSTSYRRNDYALAGEIEGVRCVIAYTGSGYDDDGYSAYYCADPGKLGLSPYTPGKLSMFF